MRNQPLLLSVLSCALLCSCGLPGGTTTQETSGGRSAVFTTDTLARDSVKNTVIRTSATLGLFVTEYLTVAPVESAVRGGINAVATQSAIIDTQRTVTDPDFELLQAFQDTLQVDVSDLLNRSTNREESLDTYAEALRNVATHANDRYKELAASLTESKGTVRTLLKEKNDADRAVKKALADKDYEAASSAQKTLTEKDAAYADANLRSRQLNDMVTTLDQLLTLYGQKILAMQQNREALISGVKVVDVPGIDQLKIIQRTTTKTPSTRRGGSSFDSLFQGVNMP